MFRRDRLYRSAICPSILCPAVIAAATLSILSGCVVGPDFKPPSALPTDGYSAETPASTASDSSGNAPAAEAQKLLAGKDIPGDWWTLFRSPDLTSLIQQAFKANPDLTAAQAALREARESVAVSEGGYLPTLSGTIGGSREKENGASFGQPGGGSFLYSVYNTSVNISYTPDVFGGVHRQVEASTAAADDARYQLEAAYLTLSANVVTAAIQEASSRGQIEATEDIVADERHQLDVLNHQFELGGVAKADVLAEQAQVAEVEATLPPLRKALAQTRTELAVYLGRSPAEEPTTQFTLEGLQLPDELPVSLPSALVEQRPDILEASANLHQASAKIGVAVANMLPNFTLTGSFGDVSTTPGSILNSASNVWSLGGSMMQPLLDEVTLAHKKKVADAAFDVAAAQYRSTVLKAFQDVADTLHAIDFDAQTLRAQVAAEAAAAESLNIAKQQYQFGAITYPTLLNAQKTEQQAKVSVVQARGQRFADTAALFQALGGGWWHRDDVEQSASAAGN